MHSFEKPPLAEVHLSHIGVKGMRWGKRKVRPDEAERKKTFGPEAKARAEKIRKIKMGLAVVGGVAVVGLVMTKSGRTKMTDVAVTNYVQQKTAQAQARGNPFGKLTQKFRDVKAASIPDPSSLPAPDNLIAEARMAGVRDRVFRGGSQKLSEQAWRDSANFNRLARENSEMNNATQNLLRGTQDALAKAKAYKGL